MSDRCLRRVWYARPNGIARSMGRSECGFVSTRADAVPLLTRAEAYRRLVQKPVDDDPVWFVIEYVGAFESHVLRPYVVLPCDGPLYVGAHIWEWATAMVPVLDDEHAWWRARVGACWYDETTRLVFSDWLQERQGMSFEVRLLQGKLFDTPYGRRPAGPPG